MTVMEVNTPIVRGHLLRPRSCARCGGRFQAISKEYSCPACRKAKAQIKSQPETAALSFRERQIVTLVRQAKANKEIAWELCLTEGTVKEYLHHIFRKLCVTSRTELALRAYRESLTTDVSAPDALSV